MTNDSIKVNGQIQITHTRGGQVIADETHKNLITTVGKNWIAARQKDTAQPAQLSHLACGTTAGGTVANNVVTYTATFPPGTGTGAITEIGLLNAASVGTLVSRAVFAVKNKEAGDTITFTWTHTAS